ncbi:conserved hypothetical archaeal protein [Trichinella spiralis]|uniref:conserved hypothetical archaeal protein n=1 Tax=Trichinella spiralis TaxID=6334 RepID=UPI0001EFEBC5|nr:conserved hypothetical archaeal protein [Trichinella spiralis]
MLLKLPQHPGQEFESLRKKIVPEADFSEPFANRKTLLLDSKRIYRLRMQGLSQLAVSSVNLVEHGVSTTEYNKRYTQLKESSLSRFFNDYEKLLQVTAPYCIL